MTTTLRPTEPLQRTAGGALSRHYHVCVNSRPVGELHLATHPDLGPGVAVLDGLRIEQGERGRGRGTVAALAAEEAVRGWGCSRIAALVMGEAAATVPVPAGSAAAAVHGPQAPGPQDAATALRLATALGYVESNRFLHKRLAGPGARSGPGAWPGPGSAPTAGTTSAEETTPTAGGPSASSGGTRGRPLTDAEFPGWFAATGDRYAESWAARGLPVAEARAKWDRTRPDRLPDGLATPGTVVRALEHRGRTVGTLWLTIQETRAYVLDVHVDDGHRGQGHGRALMRLAETEARAAGRDLVGLNVFSANTPAMRLYASLGYVATAHQLYKALA